MDYGPSQPEMMSLSMIQNTIINMRSHNESSLIGCDGPDTEAGVYRPSSSLKYFFSCAIAPVDCTGASACVAHVLKCNVHNLFY